MRRAIGLGLWSVHWLLSGLLASFLRILKPIALAVGLEDVNAVGQAVEQRAGQPFAAHHLRPLLEGQIGRDDQAVAFVGPADDVEEQFAVAKGTSGIDLLFAPVSDARIYTVEFIDQIGQAYAPVTNGGVSDQGSTRMVTVPSDAPQRFYRIRISISD